MRPVSIKTLLLVTVALVFGAAEDARAQNWQRLTSEQELRNLFSDKRMTGKLTEKARWVSEYSPKPAILTRAWVPPPVQKVE